MDLSSTLRRMGVLVACWGVASGSTALAEPRPHQIREATSEVTIDGRVEEEAWREALTLELSYEVRPGENVPPPVRTEMFLTFDTSRFLVAFKCYDPEPPLIRARYSDRDRAWNDDWVGVVLDTFNDERRAYELFVNPFGVQMDAINDDVAGSYDQAWNAIWESAGRITAQGYEVEIAIPFNQLRFQSVDGVQTWGIDGVRSYPRYQRHHIGLFPRLRGENSYLSQEEKIEGFRGVEPGRDFELLPTVTGVRTDHRPDMPAGPLENLRSEADVGVSARWGVTPNVSANLTANPDFSQVEADVVQLDVNNQFALFFPETRPFFLEGTDYFNLRRMNLVYTRTIGAPSVAAKTTGKQGRHTFGVFSARDTQTQILVPGSQGSQTDRFDLNTTATVGRYRFDVGRNSAVGATLTDRRGGTYSNQVLSVDTRHRLSSADSVSLTVARSSTVYDDQMQDRLGQAADVGTDHAIEARYGHTERSWFANLDYADYGDAFRADLGFVTQVGYRGVGSEAGYMWHSNESRFFNQLTLGGSSSYIEEQDGSLLERSLQTFLWYLGPRETFARVSVERQDQAFSSALFDRLFYAASGNTRVSRNLWVGANVRFGDQIDFTHGRPGDEISVRTFLTYNLGRHWLLEYNHTFNTLDVADGRLFTAHVAESRTVYQVSPRTFIRAILQYTDIDRNADLYAAPTDATSRDLFTQLLFSYKVNPQTVLYVGYSDNHLATRQFGLRQTDRTFFVKAGYAWLL